MFFYLKVDDLMQAEQQSNLTFKSGTQLIRFRELEIIEEHPHFGVFPHNRRKLGSWDTSRDCFSSCSGSSSFQSGQDTVVTWLRSKICMQYEHAHHCIWELFQHIMQWLI